MAQLGCKHHLGNDRHCYTAESAITEMSDEPFSFVMCFQVMNGIKYCVKLNHLDLSENW